MAARTRTFLGRGWAFPPRFDAEAGAPRMTEDLEDIENALYVLLSTRMGERTMRPQFGMPPGTFSPGDRTSLTELSVRIKDTIIYNEPRVRVTGIDIRNDNNPEGQVEICIEYEVPAVNARANMVFPYYLDEGSDFSPARAGDPAGRSV